MKWTNTTPLYIKQYRLSPRENDIICRQVQDWIERKIVVPSQSPHNFPLIVVEQGDKFRVCVDFRKANERIEIPRTPLHSVEEVLNALQASVNFSILDLKEGYLQLKVTEESADRSAFTAPQGHYHFRVTPFGNCEAPSSFQSVMDALLGDIHGVIVYIDDVIVHTATVKEHAIALRQVLARLERANLYVGLDKMQLFQTSAAVLGFRVSDGKIFPDQAKVRALHEYPEPETLGQVKSFIGSVQWLSHFLPANLSTTMAPLTDLMKGYSKRLRNRRLQLSNAERQAFTQIRQLVTEEMAMF
jgi:hypothetical protein